MSVRSLSFISGSRFHHFLFSTHAFFTRAISCVPASCPVSWALAFRRLQRSAAARISHNLSGSPELICFVSSATVHIEQHTTLRLPWVESGQQRVVPASGLCPGIRRFHDFGAPPQLGFSATSAVRRSSAFNIHSILMCPCQSSPFATSAVRRSSAFQTLTPSFHDHTALRTECRTRIASDLLAPASRHVSWGLGTSTPALRRSSGFCVRALHPTVCGTRRRRSPRTLAEAE
jgi:hypothetical protein